jgi:hypothetical protein
MHVEFWFECKTPLIFFCSWQPAGFCCSETVAHEAAGRMMLPFASTFALQCLVGACPTTEFPSIKSSSNPSTMANGASRVVITDLTIEFYDATDASPAPALDNSLWHRIEKDLFLHSAQRGAYVKIAQAKETELSSEDLVVTDIRVGKPTDIDDLNQPWQSQPGGLWVLRKNYHGSISEVVTGVDVLFGTDAVDPRPKWQLQQEPLQLEAAQEVPVARLTIRHGSAQLGRRDPPVLQVRKDGTFKIVQISDTHMVTGVGSCKDAIDGDGHFLPESVADPLTVKFLGEILDVEKPDLVLLTGDQVHHDIPDTQSALFKVAAPLIERSIPYAAVFGNHDSEGAYALSRKHHRPMVVTYIHQDCLELAAAFISVQCLLTRRYYRQRTNVNPSRSPL